MQISNNDPRLDSEMSAIHVMDREGDSYYNLDQLTKNGFRYILRGFHNRLVEQNYKLREYILKMLIEEFFKVLKTGCKIEDRQLKSDHSWYNTLSLFLKIAVDILNLRVIADKPLLQKDPSPCTNINFTVLKKKAKQYSMPLRTISDSLLLIAKLGGHLKNKKYGPGWFVLCRGYEKLLLISEGYALATK